MERMLYEVCVGRDAPRGVKTIRPPSAFLMITGLSALAACTRRIEVDIPNNDPAALVEAIAQANARPGHHTIRLARNGLYIGAAGPTRSIACRFARCAYAARWRRRVHSGCHRLRLAWQAHSHCLRPLGLGH